MVTTGDGGRELRSTVQGESTRRSRLLMHYLLNLFIASVSSKEIFGNRVWKVVNHFRPNLTEANEGSNSGNHKTSLNIK